MSSPNQYSQQFLNEIPIRDREAKDYESFLPPYVHASEWAQYWGIIQHWNGAIYDVGCGTGRFARRLLQQGFSVVGLDGSAESLRLCRERALHPEKLRTIRSDVLNLELPNESANYVLCAQVLEHFVKLPEAEQVIAEISRILKPDGEALISTYCYSLYDCLKRERIADPAAQIKHRRYTQAELNKMIRGAGLIPIQVRDTISFHRTPTRFLTRIFSEGILVFFDSHSGILGRLFGALTIMHLKKPK